MYRTLIALPFLAAASLTNAATLTINNVTIPNATIPAIGYTDPATQITLAPFNGIVGPNVVVGPFSVTLTNLVIIDPIAGNPQPNPLDIMFSADFAAPSPPIFASDSISGFFTNTSNPDMQLLGNDTITSQAFVNTKPIAPPSTRSVCSNPPCSFTDPAVGIPFAGSEGPVQFNNGPPWTLSGDLKIHFDGVGTGDKIVLPGSFEVDGSAVPEPGTVALICAGILALVGSSRPERTKGNSR